MDETRYRLREFVDEDFGAVVRISHRLNPERTHSEEELRHWMKVARTPPGVYRHVTVEESSTRVGVAFGALMTQPDSVDPRFLWADLVVDPDHQHRGVGRYLADALDVEARNLGAVALWASVRADRPRDLAFAQRGGLRECRRSWQSLLELPAPGYASLPRRAEALAQEGIEFTTLEQDGPARSDVRERLYTLFNAVAADEPRMGRYTPARFEQFVSFNLESPGFLPEAFFLARKGGLYVGVSSLERLPAEPTVLHQILTGTLREYRGHGIATELKRRTVEYGQAHGFGAIRTSNDSLNEPMWAINRKLGFRRAVERIHFEKTMSPPASG